jgi:hypothetical protein
MRCRGLMVGAVLVLAQQTPESAGQLRVTLRWSWLAHFLDWQGLRLTRSGSRFSLLWSVPSLTAGPGRPLCGLGGRRP